MSRAVMQQALEALENLYLPGELQRVNAAIVALSEALAEPEQKKKPVAWIDERGFIAIHADSFPRGITVSPLYTHPPTLQPEHDTDCHQSGICQRSGYSIGKQK